MRTSSSPTSVLPAGRHIAVTWDIPDNFGGLTKAMLQRSCFFAQNAGVDVEVLTLALQPELTQIRADLRRRKLLVDGVTLVNMWEELREYPDKVLSQAAFEPSVSEPLAIGQGEAEILEADGEPFARIRISSDHLRVVEILRTDGTVLARQSWISMGRRAPLTALGDWVVHTELWSSDGSFLGGWRGAWGLWDFWLGRRFLQGHTYAVVDSAYVGDYFAHARHERCTSMFVFHNNHLPPSRLPPFGPLGRWRRHAAEFIDNFDGAVFLTHQQRKDFELLRGELDNSHVIPNAKGSSPRQPGVRREGARGVVMANLEPRKRLDHAIRAIAQASKSTSDVSLHLYGEGPRRADLQELIDRLSAPAVLEGYTSSPESEFARASFMVLSSTNEGLPLVLAEAMSHGCVPIAYDIPYGPADVITHGVDGFLVPAADHRALARQITEFVRLGRWKAAKIRRAARHRAKDFNAASVITQWNEAFLIAAAREGSSENVGPAALADAEHLAMLHRLAEPLAQVELVDAVWDGPSTAVLTLCCWLTGGLADETGDKVTVDVRLVHREDGRSRHVETQRADHLRRANDPARSVYVTTVIDTADLGSEVDHLIMATVRDGNLESSDTIMLRRHVLPWLPMPEASAARPVLEFADHRGVCLVAAAPKVAADVVLSGDDLVLTVTPLIPGVIDKVEAVGFGDSPAIEATWEADGRFSMTFPIDGRWKLQAIVDGRRREIAWRGQSKDLPLPTHTASGMNLLLTPRGYLRIERKPAGPELIDISDDGRILSVTGPSDGVPVLIGPNHVEAATITSTGPGTWTIDCSALPAGNHRLRWRGTKLIDIPASADVENRLPIHSPQGDGSYELSRHHNRNYCRISVRE